MDLNSQMIVMASYEGVFDDDTSLQICYYVHNILRLFDGWTNFPFPTSETKRDE